MPESIDAHSTEPAGAPGPPYSEYLWPAWWIWVVILGTGGAGYVMFAPISVGTGVIAGAIVAAVLAVITVNHTLTGGKVEVTDEWVRVGRARIERRFVGEVAAFRGEEAHAARGPNLNGTAFMCFRGWIDPVVTIEITDPADSTPYWITSTRRPEELVAALEAAR
ncbi:DUF3093 domain-containing protein [Zhihengliuella salsuginis]|uniref:DUF3093 domain-containing protein n=1 Tax=Zhihengliuella salsuginis TaxID=578222 RepID=A0ABQ3GC26_9MICC|nr:DUF3093 domain-containing protein [Zhihengliuella salsuginis]GHD01186.1 hypothetical protein GCM10008096_05010 [Zhihengliuella salsuginis]